MNARTWRTIGGIAVLVALGAIVALLLPPYFENWKLQRYVNELAGDPSSVNQPPELVRASIVNKAAALGRPVHDSNVRVTRSEDALKIEVLYLVRVDLAGYSVDLHFRPAAGGT